MSEDRGRFLRDLGLILGLPFLGGVLLVVWLKPWPKWYDAPPRSDVFAVAAGSWDWAAADSFCVKNPHTISFSSDHRVMTLRSAQPITDSAGVMHWSWEYDIQESSRHHIRGQIRGEDRLTPSGAPVVWDLVLQSPDAYAWHRTDWPFWMTTRPVRRCPPVMDAEQVERGAHRVLAR